MIEQHVLDNFRNKKVLGIYHNYLNQTLRISFEEQAQLIFYGCAIVFDLGIIGHNITFISFTGSLGITFELKKMNTDPNDYKFIILSRNIKDIENKNELMVAYKYIEYLLPK